MTFKKNLSQLFGHHRDLQVFFCPTRHVYKHLPTGRYFSRSVTKVSSRYGSIFDPKKVIIENLAKWELDENSKYNSFVNRDDFRNLKFSEKAKIITKCWNAMGKIASSRGTDLHEKIEIELNSVTPGRTMISESPQEWDIPEEHPEKAFNGILSEDLIEMIKKDQKLQINAKCFEPEMEIWKAWWEASNLKAIRTEWSIFSVEFDIAGNVDAVVKDKDGKFVLIDWKRVSDFEKDHPEYAIQINIYGFILRKFYKVNISRLLIVKIRNDELVENEIKVMTDESIIKILNE